MRSTLKTVLSLMLVLCMLTAIFAGCDQKPVETTPSDSQNPGSDSTETDPTPGTTLDSYTYRTYTTALGDNWNPHAWETNAEDLILSYLSSPFCYMQVSDSELGIYQWVFDMATSIEDVTKDHKDDLTKYAVTLQTGKTVEDTESGYVYEIKLNPDAKWQDGTPIKADDYIESMKLFLDPSMKNYRANLTYAGESAVAGGDKYFFSGTTAALDNYDGSAVKYAVADLVLGEDGNYTTPEGGKVYIVLKEALTWLGGDALQTYIDAYGDAMFDTAAFAELTAKADENGRVPANDANIALLAATISAVADWGESEENVPDYMFYEKTYDTVDYDVVGCYKVDEYTIRYVCQTYLDYNYFLVSGTSTWLVDKALYEAGYDVTGELKTTNYGTSIETTKSYGPYIIESLQKDKQIVLVQNPNWFGYEKQADGSLVGTTPFLVDGKNVTRYQTTKIIIDVMEPSAAKQAFLKGELTEWEPDAEDLATFGASEQLYKVDESYLMSFFFNTGIDALKEMDNSKGNTNSVVLSNINFRKGFSLSIDRAEWVTSTEGYKPAFALMNNLYHYDVYNDPTSSYRNSEPAMQTVCNLYGVEYGEGTPYPTLRDAYVSINGYNLTEAKALMKTACDELVAAGLYTAGEDIHIRIAYAKGNITSSNNKQVELMNKYINAACEGSGFGKITLEAIGNLNDRYKDVPNGEFAIGYGAWGGAVFYPFRNFQVYADTEQYAGQINELGCWDPTSETFTMTVEGEEVTMTWQDWSRALIGTGRFAESSFQTKLEVTAALEQAFLEKYYRIPLAGTCAPSMLSYQAKYYTEDYNIMYSFGGLELMTYNYNDADWAAYVKSQGGTLSYE